MSAERGYWQHRLSRRTALRGAAFAGISLATANGLGCGKAEKPAVPTGPAAVQPKRGGILSRAGGDSAGGSYDTRGTTLDPHINQPPGGRSFRLFLQGLLGADAVTGEIEPELAQRWEQASPVEYIFTVQPGVKWHNKPPANGRELVAADIAFSLERARTNDPSFVSRSFLFTVDKIEALNPTTLRITAKEPDAGLITKLTGDGLLVLAPEVVERARRFTTAEEAVGTGPFILTALEEAVAAEYVRNPDYWKPGRPYLDGFRSRHFNDAQTAWAAFLAGSVDVCTIPGIEVEGYVAQRGAGYVPDWRADDTSIQSIPNTRRKPFDDLRVTRALRLLHDHDEAIKSWAVPVQGGSGRHNSILQPNHEQWDFTHEEYTKFLEWKQPKDEAVREALALLNAAGFTRSTPLKFELHTSTGASARLGELIQSQWLRLSGGIVDASLKLHTLATANRVRATRSFDYGIWGRSGTTWDVDATFVQLVRTGGSRNFGDFSDPKLDAMIDRARGIFDLAQRKAAVKAILRYMIDHHPDTTPAGRFWLSARKPQVRGHVSEYQMIGRQYEWVWLDI